MRISRSFSDVLLFAGLVLSSTARAQNLNTDADPNYYTLLGSCAEQVDGTGARSISDLESYALTTGKLSYLAAKKIEDTHTRSTPYCVETASDASCAAAKAEIACIQGNTTTDTAQMALTSIATLTAVTPYIKDNGQGVLVIVPVQIIDNNGKATVAPTTAQINAFNTLQASLGKGTSKTVAISLQDMLDLKTEIDASQLSDKLTLESGANPSSDGIYIGCLKQKIAANTCGTASDLGTAISNSNNTSTGTSTGGTAASVTDPLFAGNPSTPSAAAQLSMTAWKTVQSLPSVSNTNKTFAQSATTYSSLSKRIRTTFDDTSGSKMELPVQRGMAAATTNTDTSGTTTTAPMDGTLTEGQINSSATVQPGTCFSSSKLAIDAPFYADKPAFRGIRTLADYEILHLGSEAVHTNLNGNGIHAILTSPFRALVPSIHMDDATNSANTTTTTGTASTATTYHPFVRLRGFCPAGSTKVNIGGTAVPRIVTSTAGVATSSYQILNDVSCVADSSGKYKTYDAIVVFTGTPGVHLLELTADNIGTGGGALTCKEEIYVVSADEKDTYATYLTSADYTNDASLMKIPRIAATLNANPDTGK